MTDRTNGDRDLRRRIVVGGALNHGADIGRWRGHTTPLPVTRSR
ncbi:hypothetical protein [Nocardiopsis sp. NPDC058789]